ncbi:hypothetical protein ACL02U_31355 [Streptomyces sp. MS06]|uniref:hypothetical protein n=1 Tax=Streptomyces sp. MS06 TaxID=3385974 RepID=UPI0039A17D49
MGEPQRRVTVTHPRTQAARPGVRHTAVRDIHEQTALGEVYVRALIRGQLRLGLLVCAAVCLPLACLPPLLAYVPALREGRLWGVGLPWLVLGPPVYALLVAAGACYVRRAERNERDFAEHVHRS